jgi:hypothetical protein
MDNGTILPDGSAFAVFSLPLPDDHWIYERDDEGFIPKAPLPYPGKEPLTWREVEEAAKYAVRASTNCGKEMDFDPDALVRNMAMALLGSVYDGPRGGGGPERLP